MATRMDPKRTPTRAVPVKAAASTKTPTKAVKTAKATKTTAAAKANGGTNGTRVNGSNGSANGANGATNGAVSDAVLGEVLVALEAMRSGDFSVRLSTRRAGQAGDVARAYN